jgi:hypothetical protein
MLGIGKLNRPVRNVGAGQTKQQGFNRVKFMRRER